jgi:hypothetical protein
LIAAAERAGPAGDKLLDEAEAALERARQIEAEIAQDHCVSLRPG